MAWNVYRFSHVTLFDSLPSWTCRHLVLAVAKSSQNHSTNGPISLRPPTLHALHYGIPYFAWKTTPPPPPTSWPVSDTSAHPTLPPNGPSPNPTENPCPHLSPRLSPSPCLDNAVDVDNEDSNPHDTSPCTQSKGSDTYTEEFEHHSMPSEFIPLPEEFWTEPVKVFFPGWRVGEVLSEGIPTMKEYENNLGGSN